MASRDHIKFGKKLVSYEINPHDKKDRGDTGIHTAIFEDGTMVQGTLLVGADGSRSAVRAQLLPELKFVDTGICCIYGKSPLNSELQIKCPERYRRWITVVQTQTPIIQSIISRQSSPVTMVCDPCHFSNRDAYPHIPEDYVHFGILFPRDLLGCDLSNEKVDERLRKDPYSASMDIASEWDSLIRSLIELQDSDLTCGIRIYSAPEVIPAWRTSCRVIVIGDAIHLMSPTGGVGAVAVLNRCHPAYESHIRRRNF